MASFIELIAKIKQKNNGTFKLVDAQDVECEDGKGLDEVLNEKLDKNQGIENVGKTMVVGADGNLVVGDSSPKNVYTKEEVDYLLDDKMDKPYVPIEITDNTTITDALEGNFKIDMIKGNTYQKVETNIVPTPQRPVPINSRKTLVTKANLNIFDFEKENNTSDIPDTGTYRSIGQYQLKSNTKYVFSWSGATVPAKATLSFQIQDDKGTVLVSPFTYFNLESTEKEEAGKEVEFTTNESGIVKFAYNCTVATSSTTETYQQYWYTKILKDIALKEDVEYATEYVELRSLKEAINKFDLGLLSQTNLITNSGAYRKIEIPIKLKPNTRYKIYYENSMIPALTWAVLNIVNNTEGILVRILNVKNTENSEVEKQAINLAFTSPNDGEIYFSYYVQSYDVEGNLVPQTTELFKEKWFTKILKNIMVTEETLNQNTYVAPTVRDYKIVDHVNKTSKIVRNTFELLLTGAENWQLGNSFGDLSQYFYLSTQYVSDTSNDTKNTHFKIGNPYSLNEDCLGFFVRDVRIRYDKYNENIEGLKQWLSENNIRVFGKLQTPTEEEIAYSADDVSEVGYSWQDTTSPSPTIKSEVKPVEKIDILKTGKNLFDVDYVSNLKNWTNSNADEYFYIPIKVPKGKQLCLSNDKTIASGRGYYANFSPYKDKNAENYYFFYHTTFGSAYGKFDKLTKDEVIYLRINSITNNLSLFIEDFKHLQLEVGDVATSYEPYQEQHVNITLPQPMHSTLDGSIADEVDIEKGVYRYWLLKDKIGNVIDSVMLGSLNGDMQKYFTDTLQDESRVPLSLNDQYDTRNLLCTNYNANIESYMNASNETFSLYMDTTAKFVGCVNIERLNENTTSDIYNFIKDFEIVYPLLTPIEIPIPQEDLKLLKSLKTEQGVTNIFVGGEIKPTIEARYPQDIVSAVNKLQTKLLTLQEEVVKNV